MNLYKTNELVEAAQQVLDILQNDPVAQQQLEQYGFGTTQRQEGKKRLRTVEDQQRVRTDLQQERWALSQQVNAGLKAVRDQLREDVRIVRFALRQDPEQLHALQVDRIKTRYWECVQQAVFFYQQLQQQDLALAPFGISKKDIQQSLTTATQLLQQKKQRTHKKGLSEHNTQETRQAMAALRDWVVEFRSIARAAYRRQPQMLEMFGIRVRSSVKVG